MASSSLYVVKLSTVFPRPTTRNRANCPFVAARLMARDREWEPSGLVKSGQIDREGRPQSRSNLPATPPVTRRPTQALNEAQPALSRPVVRPRRRLRLL